MKILVQLTDGREFEFDVEPGDGQRIVDELKAKGVRLADIKNTIHVIPRGTLPAPLPRA